MWAKHSAWVGCGVAHENAASVVKMSSWLIKTPNAILLQLLRLKNRSVHRNGVGDIGVGLDW